MNENKPYMDLDSDEDLPDLTTPEWQAKFAQVPGSARPTQGRCDQGPHYYPTRSRCVGCL